MSSDKVSARDQRQVLSDLSNQITDLRTRIAAYSSVANGYKVAADRYNPSVHQTKWTKHLGELHSKISGLETSTHCCLSEVQAFIREAGELPMISESTRPEIREGVALTLRLFVEKANRCAALAISNFDQAVVAFSEATDLAQDLLKANTASGNGSSVSGT